MRRIHLRLSLIIPVLVFHTSRLCADSIDTTQPRPEILEIVECFMAPPSFEGVRVYQEPGVKRKTYPSVEDSHLGEGGSASPKYKCFQELMRISSRDELLSLSLHPNGAVRCYAVWALAIDSSTNLLDLTLSHLDDLDTVLWKSGCIGSHETVADFVIGRVTYPLYPWHERKLTPSQLAKLDSVLICTPNVLMSRFDALERTEPYEYLYQHIRQLAMDTKSPSAKKALARYQRVEDSALIRDKK